MKQSLRMMNDKIDKYAKVLEDLSDLTKKIPQMVSDLLNVSIIYKINTESNLPFV